MPSARMRRLRSCATIGSSVLAAACIAACSSGPAESETGAPASAGVVIRITGSDTMVNLDQAWAENYRKVRPDVSVQVAGGGSGVGIAGLIDGILDIAASSREMEPEEIERATKQAGVEPKRFIVGLDALAVFVHKDNPVEEMSLEELADIYGDGGPVTKWSQAGVANTSCRRDQIVRVSRQSNSGTYVYFREALLGRTRELKLGSIDQSGSKDVVTLVARTPCAIGYSGMAYADAGVKMLRVSRKRGEPGVAPTPQTALDGSYPIARPLYLFTRGEPMGPTKVFLDWALSEEGQRVVQDVGFVQAPKPSE